MGAVIISALITMIVFVAAGPVFGLGIAIACVFMYLVRNVG